MPALLRTSQSAKTGRLICQLKAQSVYQTQRFMRRHQDADDNIDALRRFLEKAPGVANISTLEAHRKGGYQAGFDLVPNCIDAFIAELYNSGWMTVM
ncbi:hypothetical protein NX786_03420 [Telluria mixta]|uniref:Uncharacterized protein n=1 Tax=Telluria mixta TaxID=34071 RepID=A0ABT2BTD5_9BURK|nr:hypothetical protein [Telluria mixta]MCS0628380.1 hypothetical protein [Telluria mixta]WEM93512.1 hypothetical protein P0M04_18575 [Telluria mixta]